MRISARTKDVRVDGRLLAVGALTRCEALINTSFNARGRPILNSIADALGLLRTDDDLDYVLVDAALLVAHESVAHADRRDHMVSLCLESHMRLCFPLACHAMGSTTRDSSRSGHCARPPPLR